MSLLPCPFCGNEHPYIADRNPMAIRCPDCGVNFKLGKPWGTSQAIELLKKKWNRRTPTEEIDTLLKGDTP